MKNEQFDKLSDEAKRLYRKIRRQWAVKDEPGLTLVLTVCQTLDEMREAQAIIAKEGSFVIDRFAQQRLHPATQRLKEARAHWLQAVKMLNLDLESLEK